MDDQANPKDRIAGRKTPLDLIPSASKHHEAWALKCGADKYGKFNWRNTPVKLMVYIGAAMRHLDAFVDGETNAPDSGVHHLGHVKASLGIILDAAECGTLIDDRPSVGKAGEMHARSRPGSIPKTNAQHSDTDGTEQMVHVYIAGPMRGKQNFNFPAFDKARDLAAERGMVPISPADIDRKNGFDETKHNPNGHISYDDIRTFASRDCQALLNMRAERGDAIALLPGWVYSTGATAEYYLALWLGLRVLDATTMRAMT